MVGLQELLDFLEESMGLKEQPEGNTTNQSSTSNASGSAGNGSPTQSSSYGGDVVRRGQQAPVKSPS